MGRACIPDCLPPCLPAPLPPCLPASCFPPCLPVWEVRPRAAAMMHLSMDINRHTGLKVCGLKLHAPRITNMGCNYHGAPDCITLFATRLHNDLIQHNPDATCTLQTNTYAYAVLGVLPFPPGGATMGLSSHSSLTTKALCSSGLPTLKHLTIVGGGYPVGHRVKHMQ